MSYNPEIPRDRYNNYGDRELKWCQGNLRKAKINK